MSMFQSLIKNRNNKQRDAIKLELEQQQDYKTYKDLGLNGKPPRSYENIRVYFVFYIKYDRRHKVRLVASSYLIEVSVLSVYSGVASLYRIRLVLFLAEINSLQSWSTSIRNAYLEAKTKEKVCIIVGKNLVTLKGMCC